jgi:hypothetical protein
LSDGSFFSARLLSSCRVPPVQTRQTAQRHRLEMRSRRRPRVAACLRGGVRRSGCPPGATQSVPAGPAPIDPGRGRSDERAVSEEWDRLSQLAKAWGELGWGLDRMRWPMSAERARLSSRCPRDIAAKSPRRASCTKWYANTSSPSSPNCRRRAALSRASWRRSCAATCPAVFSGKVSSAACAALAGTRSLWRSHAKEEVMLSCGICAAGEYRDREMRGVTR